jgi:hypothetical protein
MGATTTIRVPAHVRDVVQELAAALGRTQQEVVRDALEEYRRTQLLRSMNAAFAHLRGDPEAWSAVLAERADWDEALDD